MQLSFWRSTLRLSKTIMTSNSNVSVGTSTVLGIACSFVEDLLIPGWRVYIIVYSSGIVSLDFNISHNSHALNSPIRGPCIEIMFHFL